MLRGKEVSAGIASRLKAAVETLRFVPKLVFIRVGDDPASSAYVRSKQRLAERIGLLSEVLTLPSEISREQLSRYIHSLNEDAEVDGILIQLPLPSHLESGSLLAMIDPAKDVDGLHPMNVGLLWSGRWGLVPATPAGLIAILDHYQLPIEGRRVVIIGRSNLVGKPAAALFLRRDATVSIAHSRTQRLDAVVRQAEILISAVGKSHLITPEMVQPHAIVLDVGFSRKEGHIVGDVHPRVAEVADYLTPMPGGTGPVTVAMVIQNTIEAAKHRRGERG